MARHLHDQGVNPERWTEADPAPWAAQRHFRETGRKMDERHFEVAGRLYRVTPAVAASQRQGEDALDTYLGARPRPVEDLVDVAKVPLRHPLGQPHAARGTGPDTDAHALNLHYAKAGVDPARAHEGDPLPMREQLILRAATRAADGSDIPLGIPGIYRGYDDGYFYAANDDTRESPETQQLRRDLATAKGTGPAGAATIAASGNDPDIDEAVARSYRQAGKNPDPAPGGEHAAPDDPSRAMRLSDELRALITALGKWQAGEAMDRDDRAILQHVHDVAWQADRQFVPDAIDIAELERMAGLAEDPKVGPLFAGSAAALAHAGELGAAGELAVGDWVAEGLAGILAAATKAPTLSGIGTFLALMAPRATAPAQPGENENLSAASDLYQLLREAGAVRLPQGGGSAALPQRGGSVGLPPRGREVRLPPRGREVRLPQRGRGVGLPQRGGGVVLPQRGGAVSLPQVKGKDWAAPAPKSANDNSPEPANDNDPKPVWRNPARVIAATAATGLVAKDGHRGEEDDPTAAPPGFDPKSTDPADLLRDLGHAILQGQLPEIWVEGKRLTPPNPWGMHGSPKTRKLDQKAAERIAEALAQCTGVSDVTKLGGLPERKQIRISDIESQGNRNSVTPDVSLAFQHGEYTCIYHINTVDTNAAGEPTTRERMSIERLKDNMRKLATALANRIAVKSVNASLVGHAGYSTDMIPKPVTDDDAEIDRILEDFIANDFNCAEIIRDCELTQPKAVTEEARPQ